LIIIQGTSGRGELSLAVFENLTESELSPVNFQSTAFSLSWGSNLGLHVCHCIGFDPTDQMVATLEKSPSYSPAGIIGVRKKVEGGILPGDFEQQFQAFSGQSPVIAISKFDAFMDPRRDRNGEERKPCLDQKADGLAGVRHHVLGFRVVRGFLVEKLHGRHFPAFFGALEPVSHENKPPLFPHQVTGKDFQAKLGPDCSQFAEFDASAMEGISKRMIARGLQELAPDEARNSRKISSGTKPGECDDRPKKRSFPRECRTQLPNDAPPCHP
jgi:hypothetical protein